MRLEVKTAGSDGSSRSPVRVFRKWVIIGAVIGALIAGVVAMLAIGVVMVGGALVGAVFGAVYGLFKAAMAMLGRG